MNKSRALCEAARCVFEDHARVEVCASGLMVRLEIASTKPVQALLSRALEAGIAVRADENAGEGSTCLLLASAGVPTGNFESAMMDLFHALADGIIYNR